MPLVLEHGLLEVKTLRIDLLGFKVTMEATLIAVPAIVVSAGMVRIRQVAHKVSEDARVKQGLIDQGIARVGPVGAARSLLLDGAKLCRFGTEMLASEPAFLLAR